MLCGVRKFYIMHQGMIYLGSMLNDAKWGLRDLYYASRNDIFRKYAKWCNVGSGSSILCIKEWFDICLGSMLNDAMWGQGVLYYASGNEMFAGKIHKNNRS